MRLFMIIAVVLFCLMMLIPFYILYSRSESWLDVLMPRFE